MSAIADLLLADCNWLQGAEDGGDHIVVSSRIRLARNLKDTRFPSRMPCADQNGLVRSLLASCQAALDWHDAISTTMGACSDAERQALCERHLISRDLAASERPAAVLVRADERAAIMINEEDHVRLQVITPGRDLAALLRETVALDVALEAKLAWAVHPHYGYLTACPTNLGTGLRVSVMLHVPALVESKEIGQAALLACGRLNVAVRGLFGEGSEAAGNYFQVSNQRTLGVSEEDIVATIGEVVAALIRHERMAREALLERQRILLEDKVFRAWGLLSQARSLSSAELMAELSWLRLGLACRLLPGDEWRTLDRLFIHGQPAHLQLAHPDAEDVATRDRRRADLVRTALQTLRN